MEFVGLSAEQQAAIRDWAGGASAEVEAGARPRIPGEAGEAPGKIETYSGGTPPPLRKPRRQTWIFLLLAAAIFLAVLWWRWNRGWEDLESGLQRSEQTTAQPQTQVPADVMEKLVTHRVEPEYPAAARPGKLQGIIVLDVVVGRDGSVVNTRALNGPEILAQAAVDAMRWWRFEPYRVDGKPVVAETTVAVEFKP
jgi:TonB family protein